MRYILMLIHIALQIQICRGSAIAVQTTMMFMLTIRGDTGIQKQHQCFVRIPLSIDGGNASSLWMNLTWRSSIGVACCSDIVTAVLLRPL